MLRRGQPPNLRLLPRWAAVGLEGDLKEVALAVEGYQRQGEDRGVEEVLVEEGDLQEPTVGPEELEEQELRRNNQ